MLFLCKSHVVLLHPCVYAIRFLMRMNVLSAHSAASRSFSIEPLVNCLLTWILPLHSPPTWLLFRSLCVCICNLILFFLFSPLNWTFYLQVNLVSSRLEVIDALNDTAFSVMNQVDMSWRCSPLAVVIIICLLNEAEVCVSCFGDHMQINYRQIMTALANC